MMNATVVRHRSERQSSRRSIIRSHRRLRNPRSAVRFAFYLLCVCVCVVVVVVCRDFVLSDIKYLSSYLDSDKQKAEVKTKVRLRA
jgi:hypothetical protein